MKQLQCPDCDPSVTTMYEGETAQEIMQHMQPHYISAHKDIMANATPEKHQAWMASFTAKFEESPELPEKSIECYEDGCTQTFTSAGRTEILNQAYDHYMSKHPDIIPTRSDEQKKAWMTRFDTEWANQ